MQAKSISTFRLDVCYASDSMAGLVISRCCPARGKGGITALPSRRCSARAAGPGAKFLKKLKGWWWLWKFGLSSPPLWSRAACQAAPYQAQDTDLRDSRSPMVS